MTGIARAETLGPDGGQRTWKSGPDAATGPTGAQESAPILFPSGTMHSGKKGGTRGGGPRGMGEEGGRPGAGTRHATQPPAGAAAGGRASTVVHQGKTADIFIMMIILLLFLQKQNLAFAVYQFGSVLSLPD